MKIGNIQLKGDAVLAPIAGFTDVGFRDIAVRYGAALTYTEMISCKGMVYGSEKTKELLATTDNEKVKAVQIFGADADIMAKACKMPEMAKFDIIDINMGCPVPKIVNNGEGSALLNNPKLAMHIVKTLKQETGKVVTVKFRKGFKRGENVAVDFAKYMQDAGADGITVHGRTREDYYNGLSDWETIAKVVEAVQIPVIANGDVVDLNSYLKIKEVTKAAGIMIARGALGNPQIFKEIAESTLKIATIFKNVDKKRDILSQIEILKDYYSDRYIYSNMKKQICYYLKGMAGSKPIKEAVCHVESVQQLINIVNTLQPEAIAIGGK